MVEGTGQRPECEIRSAECGDVHAAECNCICNVRLQEYFSNIWSLIQNSWGYPFLYETYLYHIHRLDGAHNFSPYWLPIQLAERNPGHEALWHKIVLSPLVSFVPQMLLALGSGLLFGRKGAEHLPFTWFVQTAIFVTLNKVCTSQVRSYPDVEQHCIADLSLHPVLSLVPDYLPSRPSLAFLYNIEGNYARRRLGWRTSHLA